MIKPWEKVNIKTDSGETVEAVAPVIISASRATDIPAFYGRWLMNRLKRGYIVWKNPFNQMKQYVAFDKVRLFVFWTKNPKPMLKYLKVLDEKNINYYFQYTLNDYDDEEFEPNVLPLKSRIASFKKLSGQIGKDKVVWRFDPLLLTKNITVEKLLDKIKKTGDEIYKFTDKLVFSFADIGMYKKVINNLNREKIDFIEFDKEKMEEMAKGLCEINKQWGLKIATCCEEIDLNKFGIEHNKCIDDELIINSFSEDNILMEFLGFEKDYQENIFEPAEKKRPNLKDKGQRKICGCIVSKDIGEYNTCNHLCVYCYANSSAEKVKENINKHSFKNEGII